MEKKWTPIKAILFAIVMVIIAFVTLFPFLWMVLASFKSIVELMDVSKMFVFTPTLENYVEVFTKYEFSRPMLNSLLIGGVSTVLALIFGLPTAYSIGRFNQQAFSSLILLIRIIPAISFLVPWYIMFTQMNLTGTYTVLILSHFLTSLPLIIWIMIPYFEGIPKELSEAAWIDGCSQVGTFFKIMIPLSRPGILTSTLLSFIFSWNNFIFALVLATNQTKTIPTAVFAFVSYTDVNWSGLMAAAVVITLPILIISLCLQKYVVSGMTAGAVKG